MRTLAQRTAAAAGEIKKLIDDSAAEIDAGGELVRRAGTTFDEVEASVKELTKIVAGIADAGAAQETGIAQVNQAVHDIDTVTQQNAALVEQAAAAADSLRLQAEELARLVSVFKLEAGGEPVRHGALGLAASQAMRAMPKAGPPALPRPRKLAVEFAGTFG